MSVDVSVVGPLWSAISAVVWLAYGALLLVFFIRPARRAQVLGVGVLLALVWGGLAGLNIAAQANGAMETIASNVSADLDETWTLVFVSPAIEETVKTLGIVLLADRMATGWVWGLTLARSRSAALHGSEDGPESADAALYLFSGRP
jgi:RsiW-degrading membrane proteinase PrsW (M82 family)